MTTNKKRLVVKIGSSTLVSESCNIKCEWLCAFARQISHLRGLGWQVVVVSSGAIACGMRTLNFTSRPSDLSSLQASASVGQSEFIAAWKSAFEAHNITTGSILLTRRDTADRTSYLNARATLNKLLCLGVVPIVNENDTVSLEQIKFGDNDTLAALVSCLIDADECIILSDIDGLFNKNPQLSKDAKLIERVDCITPEIIASATTSGSSIGSGGMATKLNAARVLMAAGILTIVGNGAQILNDKEDTNDCFLVRAANLVGTCSSDASHSDANPNNKVSHPDADHLEDNSENKSSHATKNNSAIGRCTQFLPHKMAHAITPKKLWIALGGSAKGAVVVDVGAACALQNKGSSLLCVGITSVCGTFDRGSIVDVKDADENVIARGRAEFSSDEISLACGRTSKELSKNRLLEPLSQRPVIHRDELMVF